jgi:hypothetical protein
MNSSLIHTTYYCKGSSFSSKIYYTGESTVPSVLVRARVIGVRLIKKGDNDRRIKGK